MKEKFSNKGEKVTVEACPKCNEELVVRMQDGAEVFICEHCKFVKTKGGKNGI